MKSLAKWTTALAVIGAFVIGGAHLVSALQEEQQDPRFYGPRAHRPPGFPGGPEGGFLDGRMLRQLDLTEEQMEQLKALRKAHFEKTENEHKAMLEADKAFHEAVRALEEGSGSEDAVYTASQALAEAQAALAIARSGHRSELLSILTEAQKKKLDELRAEMEQFMKERIERRKERRKDLQQDGSLHRGL